MQRMTPYGPEHVGVLVLLVVVAAVWIWWARRNRGSEIERRLSRTVGWVSLMLAILWTLWAFLPQNFTVEQSLPFHFSDAMRYLAPIALITRSGWAVAMCAFWGLTLNLQSVLTPDLNYERFPPLEFTMYWLFHGLVLVTSLMFVWGLGFRPTWRGYAVSLGAAIGWAVLAVGANAITGANYGYLAHAPAGPSLLDHLGGWPWYIGVEVLLVAGVWALMTWAWEASSVRRGAPLADPARMLRRLPDPR